MQNSQLLQLLQKDTTTRETLQLNFSDKATIDIKDLINAPELQESEFYGHTPFTYAISKAVTSENSSGFESIVEYLIEQGADVNLKNYVYIKNQNTAIYVTPMSVCMNKSYNSNVIDDPSYWNIFLMLIKNGANPNEIIEWGSLDGYTPFLFAASGDDAAIVEILIHHGAEIDKRMQTDNDGGITALGLAAQECNIDIVQLLMRYGADPNIKVTDDDYNNMTPLEIAVENKNTEVVEFFINAIPKLTLQVQQISWLLIANGPNVVAGTIKIEAGLVAVPKPTAITVEETNRCQSRFRYN